MCVCVSLLFDSCRGPCIHTLSQLISSLMHSHVGDIPDHLRHETFCVRKVVLSIVLQVPAVFP